MKEIIGISGSHGFIGKHLSERLGQFERLDREGNVSPGVDVIFDLASYGNMFYQPEISEIYQANVMRVINLSVNTRLDTKLIYISTSSVILPEQSFYSASKKAAEDYLRIRSGTGVNQVAIVRPFTIIGIGEQKEHLIPKLIGSCLNGTEMPFVREPVHDFLDVEDFVDALLMIKNKAQFKGEIYEVGSGKQTSNDEVRLIVEAITGKKANIRLVESMRSYDTKDWRANIERIFSLGWEPRIDLRQTIKRMIEHER